MNNLIKYIHLYPFLVTFVSLLIGYIFMPVVIKIAKKYDFVVSPNKRTSHQGNIPNVGGINIFISFLLASFLFSFNIFSEIQYMLLGLFIILIIGFIDDLITVKVSTKLLGQFTAAFFLIVLADIRLSNLHGFLGIHELPLIVSYLLSFFVFTVIVNAINLIDGIDGLASGLGIVYMLFYAIFFQLVGHVAISLVAYAMMGSLAVFFIYNVFSKSQKIFMGDSGSLLLGYVIIVLTFLFNEMNAYNQIQSEYVFTAAPAFSFTLLIVPLFDTLRVMLTRMKKGYSPFKADRNHVHHLMLGLGMKHRNVSFILIGINALFIILGLFMRNFPIWLHALIVLAFASILTKTLWRLVDLNNERKAKLDKTKL